MQRGRLAPPLGTFLHNLNRFRATSVQRPGRFDDRRPLGDLAFHQRQQGRAAAPILARNIAAKLKQSLDANDASVEALQQLIENQGAELVRINSRYDAELARLKKLWAGAAPGSLAATPAVAER